MTTVGRFWAKVHKTETCWLWVGAKSHLGYGSFNRGFGSKIAPRISWELTYGPIPIGMNVCHACDNPPCVKPTHLFLGTQSENMLDCSAKGRLHTAIGERNGRHKLNMLQVRIIRRLTDELTTRETGEIFGVSHTTIRHTQKMLRWS